jgi:hypothetical protein
VLTRLSKPLTICRSHAAAKGFSLPGEASPSAAIGNVCDVWVRQFLSEDLIQIRL